ncbi:MAG: glycerol kinase GlpK [Oscillochloris sp.]|nr:glycerol kinase GlpK [Oscillochloris sp.]
MSDALILAIDQGTTNTKALLVNSAGTVVARTSHPVGVSYPQPAWVEQDAHTLWRSVHEAIDACLEAANDPPLVTLAISNQRETALIWDRRTGKPLGPAVVWQCRRTAGFCEDLRAQGAGELLHQRTGLAIDPLFSASKLHWLLDRVANGVARAAAGEICAGTVDSWLLWNLTGGQTHACDMTNAARTQLLDLRHQIWDAELCALFGIPQAALPAIQPSSSHFGTSVATGRLPAGVPIGAMIGDSHAALFGQGGFEPGTIKATYGTGSSLMMPTHQPVISTRGLSTTIAWANPRPVFALEGNITVTGAAIQWLAQLLNIGAGATGVAALAEHVADNGGVYVVPAFAGLGAPYWNDTARGVFSGLTQATSAAHLARAAIESIAYQVRDVFDQMAAEAGTALTTLLADGGASQNDRLMQFQADILGRPVLRSASSDVSALGAAYLAGLTAGVWESESAIAALPRPRDRFEPQMAHAKREEHYAGWRQAVDRALLHTGE